MVSTQPTVLGTSLTKVTVTPPHPSDAVTLKILGAGTGELQPGTAKGAGHVMVGTVRSTVLVIVCVQDAVFPFTSVAM